MDVKAICKNCRFSELQNSGGNNEEIFCHEKPPVPIAVPSQNHITGQVGIAIQIIFPMVKDDLWCGKWEEIPAEKLARLDS